MKSRRDGWREQRYPEAGGLRHRAAFSPVVIRGRLMVFEIPITETPSASGQTRRFQLGRHCSSLLTPRGQFSEW